MKTLVLVLSLVTATSLFQPAPAQAENCLRKVGYVVDPYNDVLGTVAAGWFQWLNPAHWANCTETGNHLHCTIPGDSNTYDFYWYAGNGTQFVVVYDQNGTHFRDITNSFPAGLPWSWTWDPGAANHPGRLTFACNPDPYNPCGSYTYGTCD